MCLPEHDNAMKLANEFASFFVTKIKLIKEDLNKIHIQEPWLLAVNTVKKLHYFSVYLLKTSPKLSVNPPMHIVNLILFQHGY